MITRIVLVLVAMMIALAVAAVLRQRKPDAPTQGGFQLPTQLDRKDFPHTETPWLVALFSSSTCDACADVYAKARVLESHDVAVVNVDYIEQKDLHARYNIEAVPSLVIADIQGVVHNGYMGPVKAQDLWAAVAECREPGRWSGPCQDHNPVS